MTVQEPFPVQAPDQPVKLEPTLVVCVKLTVVLSAKLFKQIPPQSSPPMSVETDPTPVPFLMTLNSKLGIAVNAAVTVLARSMLTVQVVVPVQVPPQPAKRQPASGVAVRAMLEPCS